MPPRFFSDGSSRACLLAFASAKEGRGNVVHEGLVGSLQFEGRICEELLRVSSDGMIRVFAAHDCDKPRVKIARADVLLVKPIEGQCEVSRIFLQRLYVVFDYFQFPYCRSLLHFRLQYHALNAHIHTLTHAFSHARTWGASHTNTHIHAHTDTG